MTGLEPAPPGLQVSDTALSVTVVARRSVGALGAWWSVLTLTGSERALR